jgi:hypothetical protein
MPDAPPDPAHAVRELRAYIQKMQSPDLSGHDSYPLRTPAGFNAVGVFLFFGASMACLAATTLLWRGTALDRVWALNPTAYAQLAPLGKGVGILFLFLSAALASAGIGWFGHHLWGWRLAVVIIAIQMLGDFVNCIRGDFFRGGTGLILAGAVLFYMLRPKIRATFARNVV